jgi:hypothetical protein
VADGLITTTRARFSADVVPIARDPTPATAATIPEGWCSTCSDNVAGPGGECSACSAYRRKYGRARPERAILVHLARRARGGSRSAGRAGAEALSARLGDGWQLDVVVARSRQDPDDPS